jgi:probable F420-dependent oxidoreductase
VKFGVALGVIRHDLWTDTTAAAERCGYESVWVPDHLVLPTEMTGSPGSPEAHPPIPPNTPMFDAMTSLAYLAGSTSRIRLGTCVYNIGLRHPFITARAVATVDVISNGRLEFGLGAGWMPQEWDAVRLDFSSRGSRIDEALSVCRALWSQQIIEHHGDHFDFDPVMFEPKPLQPNGPRIHIGGNSLRALRRVAVLGDGWMPMNHAIDDIAKSRGVLARLWHEQARSGSPEITIPLAKADLVQVGRAHEVGVDRVIVCPPYAPKERVIAFLETLATDCI